MTRNRLAHRNLLTHPLQRVLPLQQLQLCRRVLVEELVDGEVASADTNVDLVFVNADQHALASELIDTLRLAHEHDLQLLAVRVVVDVLSDSLVDCVALDRDVDCDAALQVNDVVAKCFNLDLHLIAGGLRRLQLFKQLKRRALRLIVLLLQLNDVCRGGVQFVLEVLVALCELAVELALGPQLRLNILKATDDILKFDHLRLEGQRCLSVSFNDVVEVSDPFFGGLAQVLDTIQHLLRLTVLCALKIGDLSVKIFNLFLVLASDI